MNDAVELLKRYNAWRSGEDERTMEEAGISPGEITLAIGNVIAVLESRQPLQAEGKHPAPCARHCESVAYEIEIRHLKSRLEVMTQSAQHWKANHDAQVELARILTERVDLPFERVDSYRKWKDLKRDHDRYEALRKATPKQFLDIWTVCLSTGRHFDDMVDELVSAK